MKSFFKDLLKSKPKETSSSIIRLIYFDRNRNAQLKEMTMEVEIFNTMPTLENLLTRHNLKEEIESTARCKYASNESKLKELSFIIINEENRKTEIRVSNDTNIYLLLLKKEHNLYYIPPYQPEAAEIPKGITQPMSSSIKESHCQMFSKKNKKCIKFKLLLYLDRICLLNTHKKAKEKNVKFSEIVSVEEKVLVDETKNKGYNMRLKTNTKSYVLRFKSESDYDNWLSIIKGKVNLWRENFIIEKYNKIEKENYEGINEALNEIINNMFDLNSILSIHKSRSIFFDIDGKDNQVFKDMFEFIISYKKSIQNINYFDAILYYEQVFNLIKGIDKESALKQKLMSENYFKILSDHKAKIENCKEEIRKGQSESIAIGFDDINKAFRELASLEIFDELYKNIIEHVFLSVYNDKKNAEKFCKEIECVLLYYFEKENDYGLSDFIDIHGRVKDFVLNFN